MIDFIIYMGIYIGLSLLVYVVLSIYEKKMFREKKK